MTSSSPLSGKKGLIIGLANDHSIAYGSAHAAREQGAELVLSCLNEKAFRYVEPLAQALDSPLYACDVEKPGELEALVNHAVERMGRIDFVIHSFATLAKLCAPHMTEGGSMLTMSYLGADEAVPHYGLMGPVKAALESLVRYMAMKLGPRGIRVHAVSPGPIMTRAASGIASFDELMENAIRKAPLGRLVTLEEISNLCAFLCSDASSGMTGQTIYVDAGCHAVA